MWQVISVKMLVLQVVRDELPHLMEDEVSYSKNCLHGKNILVLHSGHRLLPSSLGRASESGEGISHGSHNIICV